MSNPKKPNRFKVIAGTDQPCRMNPDEIEYDPLEGDIETPDWLGIDGQKYWERIVPILQKKKTLTEADLEALEVTCMLYDEVKRHGKVRMIPKGNIISQLRMYQCQFGLTPVSRASVKGDAGEKKQNPFEKNGRRPAKQNPT
jgi:phage terminase small subunit